MGRDSTISRPTEFGATKNSTFWKYRLRGVIYNIIGVIYNILLLRLNHKKS
jgi:hypothetical protein